MTPLESYTEAWLKLDQFKARNADVFIEFEGLQKALAEAEAELKAHARDNGACENDRFTVSVQYKTRKWYDTDTILQMAPHVKDIPGVVVQTIDKAKIETLAKGGMLPEDVTKAAYREEALTPAVSIKAKGVQP